MSGIIYCSALYVSLDEKPIELEFTFEQIDIDCSLANVNLLLWG